MAEGEKSAGAAELFLALGEQSSAVAIAPAAAAGADEAAAAAASAAANARLFRVRHAAYRAGPPYMTAPSSCLPKHRPCCQAARCPAEFGKSLCCVRLAQSAASGTVQRHARPVNEHALPLARRYVEPAFPASAIGGKGPC